ncbi:hypothetical protein PFISCL1PPCAC_16754, partial [Pristionchus fissidentatus]
MAAFTLEGDNLRLHRFRNLGKGRTVPYKNLIANDAKVAVDKFGGALDDGRKWLYCQDDEPGEDNEEDDFCYDEDSRKSKPTAKCAKRPKMDSTLFECPFEGCGKEYLTERNLEKLDRAIESLTSENENGRKQTMAWALPKRRRSTRFPSSVKKFLKNIFKEGDRSGVKKDPREAATMIAGVYTGFKKTKLDKRDRRMTSGSRSKRSGDEDDDENEPDEVNELFNMEGDPELEYKTEPLFDDFDIIYNAI